MEKNKRKESYEPPRMEILEIMVEQAILNASGLDWDGGYGQESMMTLNSVKDLKN